MPDVTLRTVSYGGGVQSTALLVLAAQGAIDFPTFLFCNVGDDSEHPDTLRYVREVAVPYAAAHGVALETLQKVKVSGIGAGQVETLKMRLDRGDRSIPLRREKDGPPMSRSCTVDFKVRPIARWLKQHGATAESPATVAIGISVDEVERAKPGVDPRNPLQNRVYPLLDLGMHRSDCESLIAGAGLPVPPKSSCYFCPYHSTEAWRRLKRRTPELFAEAVAMEARLSASSKDGRPVFLTRAGKPLDHVVDDQPQLDGIGDDCDSGWCFT
jgi:3'-phosphoadenosine 5'-phosphosulfate sulfotransferase (PAPS reductase)/FAD synthetase